MFPFPQVGIHTGKVLCGIVGKRRFKFDVWSNDVSLANKMESTGKPGMVHISEKTYSFLKEEYFVQEGDPINGEINCFNSVFNKEFLLLLWLRTLLDFDCHLTWSRYFW